MYFTHFKLGPVAATQALPTIPEKEEKKKITLAMFNFFGTLAYGDDGRLFNYEKVMASSPFLDQKFNELMSKGYTLAIVETMPKNKLESFRKLLENFYKIFSGNKLTFDVFVFNNKKHYEYFLPDLLEFYKPYNDVFGEKSFYCGDEVSPSYSNPFFRHSDNDLKISQHLGFYFYDPHEVASSYEINKSISSDFRLIITYGSKNSGFEMDYEYEKNSGLYDGLIPCKFKNVGDIKQIYIKTEDLFKYKSVVGEKIYIPSKTTFIIYGPNYSVIERSLIRNYFIYSSDIIYWYGRPPYQKYEDYDNYVNSIETNHPSLFNEKTIRIS
jgi:hypothetical protein